MKKDVYKLGIVGYGGMGAYHPRIFSGKVDGLLVGGVFDADPSRLAAARSDGFRAFDSLEALLASDNIDVVLVATPNDLHASVSIGAMRRGKHVVCEKPAARNLSELEEMIAVSAECGVLFTVHQNRRLDHDYLMVRDIFQSGKLGEIFSVVSRVQGSNGVPSGWRREKAHGGGMLLGWGVHLIDQLLILTDEPVTRLYCDMQYVERLDCEDTFELILTFENGLRAAANVGTRYYLPLPRWSVSGTEGAAVIEDWKLNGRVVRLAEQRDVEFEPTIALTAVGPTKTMAPRSEKTLRTEPLPDVRGDAADFYRNLVAAMRGEAPLAVLPGQVARTTAVMDAAFRSAKTHQALEVRI